MMNCIKTRSLFSEYIDRQLGQKKSVSIAEHLSVCSECWKECENFMKILTIMKKLKTFDAPRNYLEGIGHGEKQDSQTLALRILFKKQLR